MKLLENNVQTIFFNCLFEDGEEGTEKAIMVKGITATFGFNPDRIKENESDIYDMLKQLPDSFQKDNDGGMSFLNACNNKDGRQWTGIHIIMEQLIVLGLGCEKAGYCTPPEYWPALPGGMPYIVVL